MMKQTIWRLTIIGFTLFVLLASVHSMSGETSEAETAVSPLLPNYNLFQWYSTASTHPPNPEYFGIYTIEPIADTVYVGFGSARPAEQNGAILGQATINQMDETANTLTMLGQLDEQGVHEMAWDASQQRLHVASSDPMDSWEAGNHYTYDVVNGFQKYRNPVDGLVNVIHTWGLLSVGDNTLYASTSGHNGEAPPCVDGVICMAQIWYTADGGQTWTHRADVGAHRAFDIVQFNGKLYALYADERVDVVCYLSVSEDEGYTWETLQTPPLSRVHLTTFEDKLVAVSWDRTAVITLSSDHELQTHSLPMSTTVGVYYEDIPSFTNYGSVMAVENTLYLLATHANGYAVLQSTDLIRWHILANMPQQPTALAYWPEHHQLLVGGSGLDAQLWGITLPETSFIYLPIIAH